LPGHSWYSITNSADDVADVAIYGEIGFDGVTHSDFANELRTVTAKNITLRINSPGGSVDEGIGIYNAIKDHPAKVTGYVEAAAHSIASVILQAADKRVMAPHSRMMIHRAMAGGAGFTIGYDDDFDELARQAGQVAAQLRETSDNIASIYSERSGKDSAYWLGKMKAETRFTDKAAVDEGLADEVGRSYNAANFKIAANFDWAKFSNNADEIKAEMEAVADTEAEPKLAIPEDHLANLESLAGDVLAAVKAIRESNKAPEPEPDPRDAARRDLETALARVKL
jgi:ATP-dependent protease ClpP protease subunit